MVFGATPARPASAPMFMVRSGAPFMECIASPCCRAIILVNWKVKPSSRWKVKRVRLACSNELRPQKQHERRWIAVDRRECARQAIAAHEAAHTDAQMAFARQVVDIADAELAHAKI